MPFDKQTTLASPTGAVLNLHTRRADAHAAVQINHGLAEHAAATRASPTCSPPPASMSTRMIIAAMATPRRRMRRSAGLRDADGGAKVIADIAAVHELIASANIPVCR